MLESQTFEFDLEGALQVSKNCYLPVSVLLVPVQSMYYYYFVVVFYVFSDKVFLIIYETDIRLLFLELLYQVDKSWKIHDCHPCCHRVV